MLFFVICISIVVAAIVALFVAVKTCSKQVGEAAMYFLKEVDDE